MGAIQDLLKKKSASRYSPRENTYFNSEQKPTLSSGIQQPTTPPLEPNAPPAADTMATQTAPQTRTTAAPTQAQNPNAVQEFLDSHHRWTQGELNMRPQVDPSKYMPTYTGTPMGEAQDNVDLEYNNRIRALEWAAGAADRNMNQAMDTERFYGAEIDPRLQAIYGALGNSLTGVRDDTSQGYQSAIDQIRAYYDEAGQANQALNTNLTNRINTDAERLGIQAAIPDATRGMQEDFGFLQGMNNNAKAGRSANLAQLAAQIRGLDNTRIGSSQREGAQQRASLQNEVARTLGQLGVAGFEEQGDYRNQIQGLGQDKATALRQELARITKERSGESRQAQLDALAEFLGLSENDRANAGFNLGKVTDERNYGRSILESDREFNRGILESDRNHDLARTQLGADINNADRNYELQVRQLGLQERELQAKLDAQLSGGDILEAQKTQAEIEKIQAQTQSILQQNGQAGFNSKYGKGQAGLSQFYSSPTAWWNTGAGPKFRSTVDGLVQAAQQQAMTTDPYGKPKAATDPYQIALSMVTSAPGYINKDALKTALQIYFQGIS